MLTTKARLAIVIVTRNRRESLLRTLNHLTRLEEDYPIVVVDNASNDGTAATLRNAFPEVRVITLKKNHGAVARNFGVEMVEQPYVAFSDDDSWWAYGSLSQAVKIMDSHPRLGVIMSKILVGPEERVDPCCQTMQNSPLPNHRSYPGVPVLGFIGCGAILNREAFLSAHGFCARFNSGGEEALLAMDIANNGWGLAFIPEIVSHHYPSKNRERKMVKILGVRNALWTNWIRWSLPNVLRKTTQVTRQAFSDRDVFSGLLLALGGLFWVLRNREPIPRELETQLELVEADRGDC